MRLVTVIKKTVRVPNVNGFGFASRTYSLLSSNVVVDFLVSVFFWFALFFAL